MEIAVLVTLMEKFSTEMEIKFLAISLMDVWIFNIIDALGPYEKFRLVKNIR